MTSKCITSAPALSTFSTSSPSLAKSAERMDGAMMYLLSPQTILDAVRFCIVVADDLMEGQRRFIQFSDFKKLWRGREKGERRRAAVYLFRLKTTDRLGHRLTLASQLPRNEKEISLLVASIYLDKVGCRVPYIGYKH